MNWTEVSAIASAVGTLISALGVIFIFFQVRHFKRQITGSACAALYDQMLQIDRYFAEHPEMKAYIYSEKPIKSGDSTYHAVSSIAEMMVDLMEHLLVQKENLPPSVYLAWLNYMGHLYDHSPIIREHMTVSGVWGSDVLRAIDRPRTAPRA